MSEKRSDYFWAVIAVVTGIVILLAGWSWRPFMSWGPFMPGMMGMMGFGMGFMFLISLAFLVLIGLGIYYLIMEFTRRNRPSHSQNGRSLEILKERYAKGEITKKNI